MNNAAATRVLEVRRPGTVSYGDALELQSGLVRERRAGVIPDTLLLLQHPHVITRGSGTNDENILLDEGERERRGIQLFDAGRGGDVTYHGPGQLVGYPILDLKPDRCDLHHYLRDLEEVLIRALAALGLDARREPGMTGVWLPEGKVAAIGVRVSSGWITSHGFALNVAPDLDRFRVIIPCGIEDRPVTSLARVLGAPPDPVRVETVVVDAFLDVFGRSLRPQPEGGRNSMKSR